MEIECMNQRDILLEGRFEDESGWNFIIIHMVTLQPDINRISNVIWSGGGYKIDIKNVGIQRYNPQNMAIVLAEYHGKRIIYDMMEGYQNPEGMKELLIDCDC